MKDSTIVERITDAEFRSSKSFQWCRYRHWKLLNYLLNIRSFYKTVHDWNDDFLYRTLFENRRERWRKKSFVKKAGIVQYIITFNVITIRRSQPHSSVIQILYRTQIFPKVRKEFQPANEIAPSTQGKSILKSQL